jgi:hypothetical protein
MMQRNWVVKNYHKSCYMSTMVEFVAWWASIAQKTPAWLVKANTNHRGQSEEQADNNNQSLHQNTHLWIMLIPSWTQQINSLWWRVCEQHWLLTHHGMFVLRESHPVDQPSRTCAWMHTVKTMLQLQAAPILSCSY